MCSLTRLVQLHVLVSNIVKKSTIRSCENILKIVNRLKKLKQNFLYNLIRQFMWPHSLSEPFRPIISYLSHSAPKSKHTNEGQQSFVDKEALCLQMTSIAHFFLKFRDTNFGDIISLKFGFCFWRDSPQWVRATSFTRFLNHT